MELTKLGEFGSYSFEKQVWRRTTTFQHAFQSGTLVGKKKKKKKLLVRGFRLVWKITSDAAGQVEENSFDWHHSALFFLPGDGHELISEFSYITSIVVFIKRTCYLTELNIPWAANSAERVRLAAGAGRAWNTTTGVAAGFFFHLSIHEWTCLRNILKTSKCVHLSVRLDDHSKWYPPPSFSP
jgi:hypothetical protein